MTENEAIDKLNNLHYKILHSSFSSMVYESEIEALCMAKDCLKEIQQYRAIGTVEEFKALKEKNYTLKALYEDARKEGKNLLTRARANAIDEFANTLIPRLTDAIYKKDVESMTNLINDVARELKEGGKNE